MDDQIVQLTAVDFHELMDLMDLVFSQAHGPTAFAELLPALYQPTDWHTGHVYGVRRDGGLRAAIGAFPLDWRPGGVSLPLLGIGGVASHPRYRGHKLMRRLMEHLLARMQGAGTALSYLGGQRQRYGYFGYELGGCVDVYSLSPASLRHSFGAAPALSPEPVDPEDGDAVEAIRRLHAALPLRCERPEADWPAFLRNWKNRAWLGRDAAGAPVAYLIAKPDGSQVVECAGTDVAVELDLLRGFAARGLGHVEVRSSGIGFALARRLGAVGESVTRHHAGNWRIFDWPRTVSALLALRALRAALAPGRVRLGIDGVGVLALEVTAHGATRVAMVRETADLQADALLATRLLFGPLPPSAVLALPPAAAVLDAWCPLPLALPKQDAV